MSLSWTSWTSNLQVDIMISLSVSMEITDLLLTKLRWVCLSLQFCGIWWNGFLFIYAKHVVQHLYHVFLYSIEFWLEIVTSNQISIWSKKICVSFKTDLSLRCLLIRQQMNKGLWWKCSCSSQYFELAVQKWLIRMFFRTFRTWACKSQSLASRWLIFWWLPDAWRLSIWEL